MFNLGLLLITGVYVMSGLVKQAKGDTVSDVINSTADPANVNANNSSRKRKGIVSLKLTKVLVISDSMDSESVKGNESRSSFAGLENGTYDGSIKSSDFLNCEIYRKCLGQCSVPDAKQSHHECHCDMLCWFYGDCCLDYYESCLKVDLNETDQNIMLATLSKLDTYGQVLEIRKVVKLIKMSDCVQVKGSNYNTYVVSKCSTDPESKFKFDQLHEKLNEHSDGHSVNAFVGINKTDIVEKCQRASKSLVNAHILDSTPVSWSTAYHTVHFQNVFCAICNGINPEDVVIWESKTGCYNTNNITEAAMQVLQRFPTPATGQCKTAFRLPNKARICAVFGKNYVSDNLGMNSKLIEGPSSYEENNKQDPTTQVGLTMFLPGSNISSQNIINTQIRDDDYDGHISEIQFKNSACVSTTSVQARLCHMYNYPYYDANILQKNPNCRFCHTNESRYNEALSVRDAFVCSSKICSCAPIVLMSIPVPPILSEIGNFPKFASSFRILFDFRRHTTGVSMNMKTILLESKSCPENQTYVPFYHECRDIVCLNGGRLVGQKCIASVPCSSYSDEKSGCYQNVTTGMTLVKPNNTMTMRLKIRSIVNDDSPRTDEAKIDQVPLQDDLTNVQLSLLEVNVVKRLWKTVLMKRGRVNTKDAVKRLTSEIHEILVNKSDKGGDYKFNVQALSKQEADYSNRTCIFINFIFKSTDAVDSFLAAIKRNDIGELLVSKAHEYNLLLDQIEVSTSPYGMSQDEIHTEDGEAKNNACPKGQLLAQRKFNIYTNENQSYFIQLKGESVSLSKTVFTSIVDFDTENAESGLSSAEISVCEQKVTEENCSYFYFNMSDVVLYEGSIVITKHTRNLTQYFSEMVAWRKNMTITDLVDKFEEKYGLKDNFIYSPGSYILKADGVYVCNNYSHHYNLTKAIESNSYPNTSFIEQIATVISLSASIICLVAVMLVYTVVQELRNIPGKIIMSMSIALLLAQVTFLCSTLPQGIVCEVYAALQHAAWLSSFAWLTVMACNLAYVLYFQCHGSSSPMFYIFSGICWAGPLILTSCCFALDKAGVMAIGYGANGVCWIGNAKAMIYTFGVPVFTFLLITLISAVFVVRAIRKSSEFRHKSTLNHTGERMQLILCVNLSLLMGFNWVFYFLAVATDTTAMWTVFIITNGSQGCYIFLCYVARKTVLVKLCKQLNLCQGSLKKSAQDSPTVSQRVTKSTSVSRSPGMSVKNLHLRISPYSSPSTSPTPSPTTFGRIITL